MAVKCEELIYTPINAISFRVSGGIKSLKAVLENNVINCRDKEKKVQSKYYTKNFTTCKLLLHYIYSKED